MKTRLDMDKIAKRLGAERGGAVVSSGGYFGATQLLADIKTRFRVPSGGGRDGLILDRATTFAARAPNPQAPRRARGEGARARGCKP